MLATTTVRITLTSTILDNSVLLTDLVIKLRSDYMTTETTLFSNTLRERITDLVIGERKVLGFLSSFCSFVVNGSCVILGNG